MPTTLLDVLRLVVDGLLRVGGITEQHHQAAHEVINEHDQDVQDERAKAAAFSPEEEAELERLQAKQRAAQQPAEPPAEPPAQAPASPLLPGAPAQPAAPGGPF